ncbi:hypothetical protein CK203_022642 [Vitis vinifera]|uniref:Retroviral polymerase SH3-like domain-containing protein n=1 Tax=Vitis vinifera TaxID=29760 RepID=A0A438JED7_VITVI|nr:hypothetical protein CK203_022642 [Vitis vinifera]
MTTSIGKERGGLYYLEGSLADLFKEHEILHQTCTYAPQQNSTVERKNRHILKFLVVYANAHIHSYQRDKLDPHALKCIFLGYFNFQKGYQCFHPLIGKYYVSRNVQFYEGSLIFSRNVSLVPLQGEISSREKERLWLEEKRLWISSQEGFN